MDQRIRLSCTFEPRLPPNNQAIRTIWTSNSHEHVRTTQTLAQSLPMDMHELAASQLLRAIRRRRSHRALARRLRYRGNPITDWEHGRHFPTASDTLRTAELCQLPVTQSFEGFHTLPAPQQEDGHWRLAPWLNALRGTTTQQELAARCGCSRFAIRRWLTGEAEPKLPEFLKLLDALTGRSFDWVALLVPIEQVPALAPRYAQAQAAKRLAFEAPWTEALLRMLETKRYVEGQLDVETLSRALGLPIEVLNALLARLTEAGVIERAEDRYRVVGTLSVDTRNVAGGLRKLQAHWERVGVERLQHADADFPDWYAYNQISVSRADLRVVEDRLKQAYAEIRAIVASSEPTEEAALVLLHLVHWKPPVG